MYKEKVIGQFQCRAVFEIVVLLLETNDAAYFSIFHRLSRHSIRQSQKIIRFQDEAIVEHQSAGRFLPVS